MPSTSNSANAHAQQSQPLPTSPTPTPTPVVSTDPTATATYYVSTTGNDATGNGTSASPWKSLYKACNSVTLNGAVIHVNAGTYIETQQCNLAVGVSIEGDGVTTVIKSHYQGGLDRNISFLMLSNGSNSAQHISNLKLDGDNLQGWRAIMVYNRSNVSIHNLTVVDFLWRGVSFRSGGSTGNMAYNNIITNSGGFNNNGNWDEDGCLEMSDQVGMLVYSNVINQTGRPNSQNGLCIHSWGGLYGCKIYNNTIIGLEQNPDQTNWPFAMEFYKDNGPQGYGMELYGNTISGECDFAGLGFTDKGTYAFSIDIHDNLFKADNIPTDPSYRKGAIQFEASIKDIIIRNNTFRNITRPIYFDAATSSNYFENMTVYNNLFENVPYSYAGHGSIHGPAIDFGANSRPSYVKNVNILNNTFVAYAPKPSESAIYLPTAYKVDGINIKNNIFVGFATAPVVAEYQVSGGTLTNLVLAKNLFYNNGNSNAFKTINFTPTNVTNDNGIIGNPMFVSATDFHLQSSSPAIGAGVNVGIAKDKDGNAFTNPPSIGAYK